MNTADGERWDVLVAGAGTAGVVAAIQAARAGARVQLVEKNGMPGGTLTVAGVAFPGLFHAWGRQVIAGIGWELVERCVQECGAKMPDFSDPAAPHWKQQVRLDGAIYAALCDEALVEAGVAVRFHTLIGAAERSGADWKVTLATKSGLQPVTARILVDCTGDADLAALAGARRRIPGDVQPATLLCRASGYDVASLDMETLNGRFREAVAAGEVRATDAGWDTTRPTLGWLRKHGDNANHISGKGAHTSEGRTALELDARRSLLRLYRFLRKQPGLGKLRVEWMAAECGVRETVTVEGESTVTVDDYVSGRVWADALCHSFYPIDLHLFEGQGLDYRKLPEGVVPTVPRGALVPAGVEGLLVAGRCLSSDRLANSALRVQATCMATGQAAGALAALSALSGVQPRALPLERVRNVLREHGGIVPEVRP